MLAQKKAHDLETKGVATDDVISNVQPGLEMASTCAHTKELSDDEQQGEKHLEDRQTAMEAARAAVIDFEIEDEQAKERLAEAIYRGCGPGPQCQSHHQL